MLYLDANVFIHAALDEGPRGRAAARLLESVGDGKESAATSALTLDEVVWKLMRVAGRPAALEQGRRLMALPVRLLDVKATDVQEALRLMARYPSLKPRDAIHAAVALNAGLFSIVSDDPDFDAVRELTRRPLVVRRRPRS